MGRPNSAPELRKRPGLSRGCVVDRKGAYYLEWPTELVQRTPAALTRGQQEVAGQAEQVR
jgi:hypothetical protein